MKRNMLGGTGISVSEVAFGGVEIGMPYGIGVNSAADMLPETAAIALLRRSVDEGINLFDTARGYGQSEKIMGKAFREIRDKVVINTKCRHFQITNGSTPTYQELNKIISDSLAESLAALQTDYVDIFMLHWADITILENAAVREIFTDLKRSGVIRATGVSVYTPEETSKALHTGSWDVIQLPFNLLDQRQGALFPLAQEKSVGIIVRSVLLKGLLSGRAKDLPAALAAVASHISRYDSFMGASVPDLSALAIRFALSFKEVSATLVGIDRAEYLDKVLEAAAGGSLNTELMPLLLALSYPEPAFLNLHEWSVKGWLK